MADTARTLAEIKTLLADNTSGAISPQDLRDAIESIVNPVASGGFDVYLREGANGHFGIGEGVDPPEPIWNVTANTWARLAIVDSDSKYEGFVYGEDYSDSGLVVSITNTAPSGVANLMEAVQIGSRSQGYIDEVSALVAEGSYANPGSPSAEGSWGVEAFATVRDGATAAFARALFANAYAEGAGSTVTEATAVRARHGALNGGSVGTSTGVLVNSPFGNPVTAAYGVRVEPQGTDVNDWNIYSAGATSKNKFEGRTFIGGPASAPSDSDLGNAQWTAWLDEGGDALTLRVRYSNGTLKTGTVALT